MFITRIGSLLNVLIVNSEGVSFFSMIKYRLILIFTVVEIETTRKLECIQFFIHFSIFELNIAGISSNVSATNSVAGVGD